jgi:glutaminase
VNGEAFVSTGVLPGPERVQALVGEAYARFSSNGEGSLSAVYPALQRASPDDFGLCVVAVRGALYATGSADVEHSIMSVAKPFVFALVCDELGPDEATRSVGANATGLPFNAPEAVLRSDDGRTNPMVNPGAITTTSHIPGTTAEARWTTVLAGLSAFAGRPLALDGEVYASATATNTANRKLASLLEERRLLGCDRETALDLYTRQSSLAVTARDTAVMGATLAGGGVNPITGLHVVSAEACRHTLAAMATAGLYETSGDWLARVGLPGKSGIGGAMVTVSPGKGALGTYAPLLDVAGNSVKGQLAAAFLSRALGLDVFASAQATVTETR